MKKSIFLTILLTLIAFSVIAHFHNEAWEYEREISGGGVISGTFRSAGDTDGPLSASSYCTIYKTWSDTMPSDFHDGMVHHWYAAGTVSNYDSYKRYKSDWAITVEAIGHPTLFAKSRSGKRKGAFSEAAQASLDVENFKIGKLMFPDLRYEINRANSISRINGEHPSKQEKNSALTTIPF